MSKALQENIKRHLQEQNMSAAELERRTGIPHAVVNILHGRSKNPSLKTAQAIAKELGCTVEELLSDETSRPDTTQNTWNQKLYIDVFTTVCDCIGRLKLQPNPTQVANWLTEIYNYSIGTQNKQVDSRFAQWLIERS